MKNNKGTIAEHIQQARKLLEAVSASARLDAEVLMAYCLGRDRTYLFTWPEHIPTEQQSQQFQSLLQQRLQHVPLAYLTGSREFWSMDFKVSKDTLIPRADTELLVELALEALAVNPGPVLDLGTGSGIVAVCIASERPDVRVDAVDSSAAALEIAEQNAGNHRVQVNFTQSDWFESVTQSDYCVIVSNPPYLAAHDEHLQRDGLQHEPLSALVASDEGMAAFETIITDASNYSADSAQILIEHGNRQGAQVRGLMQAQGFQQVTTRCDIESRERVTLATINTPPAIR